MSESELPTILVCTVGGSPQPIRTALASLRPDRVVFVVSKQTEDSRSSRDVVEAALTDDGGPGLRHCPECPDSVSVREIPADDPDRAFAILEAEIDRLRREGKVVADYTGGTKSMSGALFLAATAHPGVRLQFMRGLRPDLQRVAEGTEEAVELPVHLIGVARDFDATRGFVAARDYAAGLKAIEDAARAIKGRGGRQKAGAPAQWSHRIENWRRWLKLLDAWDRFDHRRAWALFEQARDEGAPLAEVMDAPILAPGERIWGAVEAPTLAVRLSALAEAAGSPSFVVVEDLWLNALRRADQGRYDDAVARCYRLVEAALQAHIRERFELDTGRVPLDRLPEAMRTDVPIREDRRTGEPYAELGLESARRFIELVDPGAEIVSALGDKRPEWQGLRNRSVLAHGFTRLDANAWRQVRSWFEQRREPLWETPLGRPTAQQLPDTLP